MKNASLHCASFAGQINQRSNNLFMGTASTGGNYGFGTIIKGTMTEVIFHTVYSFDRRTASYPIGKMIMANNGKFYGTTELGGYDDSCTVYVLTPVTSTLTKVYDFYLDLTWRRTRRRHDCGIEREFMA